MKKEKLKLIVKDLEKLVDVLKTEIYADSDSYMSGVQSGAYYRDDDDDDGYAD
tara:strand:+ start:27 stop:185 length:159 start_codon:yes stop_codon:yes gene_type:complete